MPQPPYTLIDLPTLLDRFRERLDPALPTLQHLIDLCERRPEHWTLLGEWETLDDRELYRRLIGPVAPRGPLLVMSDGAYGRVGGGFAVRAEAMEDLLSRHLADFGECFFNGDAIVFGLEQELIWLFHHEGAAAVFTVREVLDIARCAGAKP